MSVLHSGSMALPAHVSALERQALLAFTDRVRGGFPQSRHEHPTFWLEGAWHWSGEIDDLDVFVSLDTANRSDRAVIFDHASRRGSGIRPDALTAGGGGKYLENRIIHWSGNSTRWYRPVNAPQIPNVALELERANGSLSAARVLLSSGHYPDAISRAYYAMFHGACALLASIGRDARSHEAVRALVAEHFIRPGLMSASQGRALSRMAGDRNDADYNVASVFEGPDVVGDIEIAESFLLEVERLLGK